MKRFKNVLLILCDQLRADFLGVYGGPNITPNIDSLAKNGLVFTKAYTPSPMCVPARMTMLTGMHSLTCPLQIPSSVLTIADILSNAGFNTAALGKMHMFPTRGPYGFKELILSEDTGTGMFLDDYHPWLAKQGYMEWSHGLDNYDILSVENYLPKNKTVTHWNSEQAIKFLKKQKNTSRPFYLVTSFVKPHPPYDPVASWSKLVNSKDTPLPIGLKRPWKDYPEVVRLWAQAVGYAKISNKIDIRQIRAHYLGLVAQIDYEIGRIIATLEESNLEKDTLIVFSSDHGDFLGDHNLFMKFFAYESSARIPLIIKGPGIPKGLSSIPVSILDFVPTLLDFCEQKIPVQCQGESILKLLDENGKSRKGVLISTTHGNALCWATRRYKYTFWPNGEEELFDLETDPYEIKNIAKENPKLKNKLKNELIVELERFNKKRVKTILPLLKNKKLKKGEIDYNDFVDMSKRFVQHKAI
ncbi:MAG: sulfatase-like hydrolase/transferase [Candidatus Firestonebacteria bacterium]